MKYIDNRIYTYVTAEDVVASTEYEGFDDDLNLELDKKNSISFPKNFILYERSTDSTDTSVIANFCELLALEVDDKCFKEYLTLTKETSLEIDNATNFYKKRNDNLINKTQSIEEYTEA
jgi:hypothetical protein